ncbi:Uncharacterized protein BP5553_04976 [Venustampulla echinocandica]|uniref:Tetratricopeptide SHNi-TPR domain-containing protein n=1 Tax=Venustampulla echinocandica TaxID=2656787 RepID=A0A370TPU7_9HELO|nr:Uncharacterized protein BP5553_04976 [Venustampulla echinocandica]RDL37543.1 Uncharacterized protein BP5553_04976 [Venustampulla echinocandica]
MAEPVEQAIERATTATDESAAAIEVFNSIKVSLADLCAKGTAQYAHKNYEDAADLYARASELQAELNGEMSPDNAEILFLYGRSLFKVGQSKSDVLGGRAGGEKKKPKAAPKPKAEPKEEPKEEPKTEGERITEEGVAITAEENTGTKLEGDVDAKKPLFQFTGDENFEDSGDEVEGEDGEGEDEEEEDDLAAAFEVLDLARVLFMKRLEQPEEEGKGKEVGDSAMTKHLKERLADAHDLLAEISLENERFPAAVSDFKASLSLKKELYPEESEVIAEAHYKLSLALEFASNTSEKKEGDDSTAENEVEDGQALREEAARELEAAINSTNLKLQAKEVELASCSSPDDNEVTRAQIADVKEIVGDMEGRLAELKAPQVDVDAIKSTLGMAGGNAMGGILGATLGESPAEAAARIEDAKNKANDLTGLVRRKGEKSAKDIEVATVPAASTNGTNGTNGKRKAEDDAEVSDNAKKAKVEDAPED